MRTLDVNVFIFTSRYHTQKHTHTNAHKRTQTRARARTHTHTHTHTQTNTHTHTHTHTHTQAHRHITQLYFARSILSTLVAGRRYPPTGSTSTTLSRACCTWIGGRGRRRDTVTSSLPPDCTSLTGHQHIYHNHYHYIRKYTSHLRFSTKQVSENHERNRWMDYVNSN